MKPVSPRSIDWIDSAPIQITESIQIEATPLAVWTTLAANEEWPEWFPGFKSCTFISEEPHGIGSTRLVHQDRFKVHEEILAWDPGDAWGMTVIAMNVGVVAGMAEHARLQPIRGSATELTFQIGVELSTWARPLRSPLVSKSRKQLRQALQALRQRHESRQSNAT